MGGWAGRIPASARVRFGRVTQGTVKRVARDVRFLKRAIEVKQCDVVSAGVVPSFTGGNSVISPLNNIAVGSAYHQRVGNKIALKDLHARVHLYWTLSPNYDTNKVENNSYRIAIVYDKLCSNTGSTGVPTTTPNFNSIFQSRTTSGATASEWISGTNHDVGDRYVVLYDKVKSLTPIINPLTNTQPTPDEPSSIHIPYDENIFIPLKGRTTMFNTSAEITEGALYLVVIALHYKTMSSNSIDNHITIQSACIRLRYYDS